jgi:hypothetical protein
MTTDDRVNPDPTADAAESGGLVLTWTEVKKRRQSLCCFEGRRHVGSIQIGLRFADEVDDPRVEFDYIQVEPDYRAWEIAGRGEDRRPVSLLLMECLHERFPEHRFMAGPLWNDEAVGPRFRRKCWDIYKVPIHEDGCKVQDVCRCREAIEDAIREQAKEATPE